jgi:ubiquinone/menaquinone biosynthesis C-methylase UbiE
VRDAEVLDIATGTGTCALCFAQRVPRVYALDNKPDLLVDYNAAVARAGQTNLKMVLGDARRMPFPDLAFSLVTSTAALTSIPDHFKVLSEVRRVLAPCGRFALGDILIPAEVRQTWAKVACHWFGYSPPSIDFHTLHDLFLATGFSIEEFRPLRWIVPLTLAIGRQSMDAEATSGFAELIATLSSSERAAFRHHQRGQHQCFALGVRVGIHFWKNRRAEEGHNFNYPSVA